ncbi:MAG: serine--tRNA ligase [Acidobacteria bacterium]|nr:MAG: serine--tRNA ligase [Acidobacteriota bacterium]
MLDPAILRDNLEAVSRRLRDRGMEMPLDELARLDVDRRRLIAESEKLKHAKNLASEQIGRLVKDGRKPEAEARKKDVRELNDRIKQLDGELGVIEQSISSLLHEIPNIPHPSVPVGKDCSDNQVVRVWGEPRRFAFTPRHHVELGEELGILDLQRAAKISGARFAVIRGAGALLERALIGFMLDLHTREHGYLEVIPPFLVNSAALFGTGQLPRFRDDLFHVEGHDLHLIPTAEVPLTNLRSGEILEREELPLRLTAYTPCFRSEAGSYGKDVRGLIRLHQFNKVELVAISEPQRSYEELERLTSNAEEVLRRLELPYRVVTLCTGDMGFSAAKTYDLEVWLPGQGAYREISSCSNCEAYQARRAGIRCRPEKGAKPEYAHTLNGSGLAVGRTLVAILENNQQADGSVVVPAALRPYAGGLETIRRVA